MVKIILKILKDLFLTVLGALATSILFAVVEDNDPGRVSRLYQDAFRTI